MFPLRLPQAKPDHHVVPDASWTGFTNLKYQRVQWVAKALNLPQML